MSCKKCKKKEELIENEIRLIQRWLIPTLLVLFISFIYALYSLFKFIFNLI